MLLSNRYAVSSCRDKVRDAGASFDWLKRIGNSSSLPKPLVPFSERPEVGVNLISQPKLCPKSHFPVYIFAQIPVPLSVFLFLTLSPNDLNLIFPVKKKRQISVSILLLQVRLLRVAYGCAQNNCLSGEH